MIFVDGDHKYENVIGDTIQALKLNPKYVLFDDVGHSEVRIGLERMVGVGFFERCIGMGQKAKWNENGQKVMAVSVHGGSGIKNRGSCKSVLGG